MEWWIMVQEYDIASSITRNCFLIGAWKWWMSTDIDTQVDITWGAIGKVFSKKEIKKKNDGGNVQNSR